MMAQVTGFESVVRELEDAQKALEEIGGELGSVNFDPHDPASVEAAIQSMEALIDEKLGRYAGNSIISPLAVEMKQKYRAGIVDKAAEARLEDDARS
jgi:hypothetical protein